MEWQWFAANLLKISFIITSPVTFVVGLFLIYDLSTYKKIEKFLSRSYAPNKQLIKGLERHRESFQMFLLEKRQAVGIICILNSVFAILTILLVLRKY